MNRDEWKKYLKQTAEDIRLPERLKPENIERQLEAGNDRKNQEKEERKAWYRSPALRNAAAAAAVLLILFGIGQTGILQGRSDMSGSASDTSTAAESAGTADSAGTVETAEEGTAEATAEGSAEAVADAQDTAAQPDDGGNVEDYFRTVSYDEIQEMAKQAYQEQTENTETTEAYDAGWGTMDSTASVATEAAADTSSAGAGQQDYSETNLLVEGVDEGDVVKTDGSCIYVLKSSQTVKIYRAQEGNATLLATIRPETADAQISYQEMYVDGNQMILAGNIFQSQMRQESEDMYRMDSATRTVADVYDISDPANPEFLGRTTRDGQYITSRKTGNHLYIFSEYASSLETMATADSPDIFLPCTQDDRLIPPEDLYAPSDGLEAWDSCQYLLMTSVDLEKPGEIQDQKAVLNGGWQVSVTLDSIYLRYIHWDSAETRTDLVRFAYEDGTFHAVAGVTLAGELTDEYALNEQDGYLRLLLSGWDGNQQTNYVYVLNEQMQVTGQIDGLAPGEMIYSARFMGDIGYFVTYRNMDPLFAVDLSDPENPRIIGELKVTGFSDYLHFYGEDQLLGIGWETDPETGEQKGLKLSMFDISDPENITEIHKMVIEGVDYCPALNQYKAFLVDPEKNVIGFSTELYDDYGNTTADYMVFSYDSREGFVQEMKAGLPIEEIGYSTWQVRGLYIGDVLYVVTASEIRSFDMEDGYQLVGQSR